MMITIPFSVGKDDVLELACHYYQGSPTVRRSRLISQYGVGIVLGCFGVFSLFITDLRIIGAGLIVFSAVYMFTVPPFYRWYLRKSAEQVLGERSFQNTFGRYTLTLNHEGLASTSPLGESKFVWKAVDRVLLTPDHLLIMLSGSQGFPISRAQVPESTIREAKEFVEAHLQEAGTAESSVGT
jgi:hypothetical protein